MSEQDTRPYRLINGVLTQSNPLDEGVPLLAPDGRSWDEWTDDETVAQRNAFQSFLLTIRNTPDPLDYIADGGVTVWDELRKTANQHIKRFFPS